MVWSILHHDRSLLRAISFKNRWTKTRRFLKVQLDCKIFVTDTCYIEHFEWQTLAEIKPNLL